MQQMSSNLKSYVAAIREKHFAFPPANAVELKSASERGVPEKLLEFYQLCDGAFLGEGNEFEDPTGRRHRLKIPRLAILSTTASYGFITNDSSMYEQSTQWWQIVDYGDSNWLAYNESAEFEGKIIDVFHETVGEPGSHHIVAESIADLLDLLLRRNGVYWFHDEFQALGST